MIKRGSVLVCKRRVLAWVREPKLDKDPRRLAEIQDEGTVVFMLSDVTDSGTEYAMCMTARGARWLTHYAFVNAYRNFTSKEDERWEL